MDPGELQMVREVVRPKTPRGVVRPKTPRGEALKPCCTATRNSCTSSDPKPREGVVRPKTPRGEERAAFDTRSS
ncbi:Uncharacterised protein [Mycobacterium tuberculosis]|nr:Uncharacterised protein [Mycobacterium tuberculosis]